MRKFVLALLILLPSRGISQIYFENPSFEGDTCCANCAPIGWCPPCEYSPFNCCIYVGDIVPCVGYDVLDPIDGFSFYGLVATPENTLPQPGARFIQQHLSCSLKKGKLHSFTLYLARDSLAEAIYGYSPGRVKIIGVMDSCSNGQLLWESPILTQQWIQYTSVFIPDDNYSWIRIKPENMSDSGSADAVDLLSAITIVNFEEVHAAVHDTIINHGACVTLTATATSGYDTSLWYKNGAVFTTGIGPYSDCPDSNAIYVVAARDTGCGQFWSYDTIRVHVIPTGINELAKPQILIPDLLSAETPVWQIINAESSTSVTLYNTLGQLVYKNKEYNNTLNINELAAATYFYEVKYGSNTYRGKLMVIR